MEKQRAPAANLVLAFGLGAPGAALLGFLLMTGLMVLAVKTARRKA